MRTILFVDDDASILSATRRMLRGTNEGWQSRFAEGGREAIGILMTEKIDVVVTDVNMPGMSGLELLAHIRKGPYGFIPVVVITGALEKDLKRQALDLGAQDLLSKPVSHEDLVARLRSVIAVKSYQEELQQRNEQLEDIVAARTTELAASRFELVVQLSKAAELRDRETGNHVLRVGMFSRAVGMNLGMTLAQGDELLLASTLHDIGKIAIPDAVLRKQGSLNKEERQIMESHCLIGHRILTVRDSALTALLPGSQQIDAYAPPILALSASIARSHHERWDGEGYPDGLLGNEIPQSARIVAIVDVLDALRSKRPYKESLPWARAMEMIAKDSGSHFDPEIHDAFVKAEHELLEIDRTMRCEEEHRQQEAA